MDLFVLSLPQEMITSLRGEEGDLASLWTPVQGCFSAAGKGVKPQAHPRKGGKARGPLVAAGGQHGCQGRLGVTTVIGRLNS